MRMTKPSITIHIGAANDEVVVDGHKFDRSKMKREEKSKLRRLIRDCFSHLNQQGAWGRQRGTV